MRQKISVVLFLYLTTNLSATTLSELVESGLNNNSAIKSSNLQTQLMEAKKSESKANRFGEVDVVGSYTHYNLPRTLAPIVPSALSSNSSVETTQDLFTTGLQYSVALFMGGALKEQVEIDKLAKTMTEMRVKLSREEIIYNIRSIYLSGLSLQELISAQNSYVDALKKLRAVIATSVDIGVLLRSEEGCIVLSNTLLHKEDGVYVMVYKDSKFFPLKVKPIMSEENQEMITPCPTESITIGSEVLLAKLPIYGEVEIRSDKN